MQEHKVVKMISTRSRLLEYAGNPQRESSLLPAQSDLPASDIYPGSRLEYDNTYLAIPNRTSAFNSLLASHALIQLQRQYGNRYVQRLLQIEHSLEQPEQQRQVIYTPRKKLQSSTNAILQRTITYLEQVTDVDAEAYLARFDRSVENIESTIHTATGAEADEMRAALGQLRTLRQSGRVTFWHISGGLVYASYDNASHQLRLHVNPEFRGQAFIPSHLLHEAIHALHATRYPRLSRMYGEVLAAGGTADVHLGILLLRWKAWTEYWAYRRQAEYDNLRQQPEFRRDAHSVALEQADVRQSLAAVQRETGQQFSPWAWTPPARYQTDIGSRRSERHSR